MSKAKACHLSSDCKAIEPPKNLLDWLKGQISENHGGSDGPDDVANQRLLRALLRAHAAGNQPPSREGLYCGVAKELTSCELYNNEMRKLGNEPVKDRRQSLQRLQLFVSNLVNIYSCYSLMSKSWLSSVLFSRPSWCQPRRYACVRVVYKKLTITSWDTYRSFRKTWPSSPSASPSWA
jgi:hypothetical protein